MSEELKWPEPDSYAVMAFGTHQKLVVRADVAEELASKYREQGFIGVSVVPLFTYAQTCELVASLRSELEAARGKVEALNRYPLLFSRRKKVAEEAGVKMDEQFNRIVRMVEHAHGIEFDVPMTTQREAGKLPAGKWSLGHRDGNWREIDHADHQALMRIVWRMEDDDGPNHFLESQARAVVAALNAATELP